MIVEDELHFISDGEDEIDNNSQDLATGMKDTLEREEKRQKMKANDGYVNCEITIVQQLMLKVIGVIVSMC